MSIRSFAVLPVLSLALSLAVAAQEPAPIPCEGLRRTVAVSVLDREGNQVPGLTAANFRGEFRGQPVKILSATLDTGPRRILLLLDTSDHLLASKKTLENLLMAAEDILSAGPPDSAIGVATFDAGLTLRAPFSQENDKARAALASLRDAKPTPKGEREHASLYEALVGARQVLQPSRPGDVVYLLSDADGWSNAMKGEEVQAGLVPSGLRVFALLLLAPRVEVRVEQRVMFVGSEELPPILLAPPGYGTAIALGMDPSSSLPASYFQVREMAVSTGGFVVNAGQLDSASLPILQRVYEYMGQFYRLEVELPSEAGKLQEWKLDIVTAKGKRMKNVSAVYPRRVAPCGASQP